MRSFLKRWLFTAIGVALAAEIIPGIHYNTIGGLVLATLLLGLLNAIVRPILIILSAPLVLFTLGLFLLVINALLLYWVGHLKNFHVDSFTAAFFGSLIISIVNLILNSLTKSEPDRIQFRRKPSSPPPPPKDDGKGPIIDV